MKQKYYIFLKNESKIRFEENKESYQSKKINSYQKVYKWKVKHKLLILKSSDVTTTKSIDRADQSHSKVSNHWL